MNLYTGDFASTLGARDVQITGPSSASFGSTTTNDTMRFNAVPVSSTHLELILTGDNHVQAAPVLAVGSYTITLDRGSGDTAFERLCDGAYLDGDGNGTIASTDNYSTTLTVSSIPAATDIVTIGDLVAEPGQTVTVPLVLSGGTGSVSDTTAVDLTIATSPADGAYTVTGFTLNSAISGASATFSATTGALTITSSSAFYSSDIPLLLGSITFVVSGLGNSGTAPALDTKTPIDITVTRVLDTSSSSKAFVGVNGFHVSAYIGDLYTPSGDYTAADAIIMNDLIVQSVKALALYPNVDPMLLADVNKSGSVTGADVTDLDNRITGGTTDIPALPTGASGVAVNGADPVLFVGTSYTADGQPADLGDLTPGSTVLVPISVQATDADGVNINGAQVAFSFDPNVFTFNGVSAGAIADGSLGGSAFDSGYTEIAAGEVNVVGSSVTSSNPLASGQTATLFWVSLTVNADATVGSSVFNLMSSQGGMQTGLQDNLCQSLLLTPAPDNSAGDNLDGDFTIQNG